MVTSGFFDSIDHDRRYNASQISSIFDGIVQDGVYMSIGSCFQVREQTPNSMNIIIGSGRAWFKHVWILNDSDEIMKVDTSELLVDRIDTVVFDIDTSVQVRKGSIKIIKGEGSKNPVAPALTNIDGHWQFPLAHIRVEKDTAFIRQANITNLIGSSETPFVTGVIQTINTDMLLAQWRDEYRAWYENFTEDTKTEMFNWFDTIKGLLGTDPAVQLAISLAASNKMIESLTNRITQLEAQLNGWSFYNEPLTQAQYNALPASEKNIRKKLHIIKK